MPRPSATLAKEIPLYPSFDQSSRQGIQSEVYPGLKDSEQGARSQRLLALEDSLNVLFALARDRFAG